LVGLNAKHKSGVKLRWLVALAVNWKYRSFRRVWIDAEREEDAAVPIHGFGHGLHHDYRVDLLILGLDLPERGWRWIAEKWLKV
jgi:hypothetical protein